MTTPTSQLLWLNPSTIYQPDRQRQDMGDIDRLAESIRDVGQLQPILVHLDEDGRYRLIAGGRRTAACKQLNCNVAALLDTNLTNNDELELMELEENVRRKELTWQERVLAIASVHAKCQQRSALRSEKWLPALTGEMLGISKSSVYDAVAIATQLKKGDEEVRKADNLVSALQILAHRALRKAERTMVELPSEDTFGFSDEESKALVEAHNGNLPKRKLEIIHADAIQWLVAQPNNSIRCIYTDPPYAIEMENLQQDGGGTNVDEVRHTHDVEENTTLLNAFIDVAAQKLVQGSGFLAMWCDFWNYRWLADACMKAGLVVQRWPLVWNKTSPCQNMAAAYNFTKSAECCLIARTPKTMLISTQPKSVYTCGNEKPDWVSNPFWKPAELHQWVLRGIAVPGSTVVDCFGGCGSIPLACINSHYDAIMVEKDDTHINTLKAHMK